MSLCWADAMLSGRRSRLWSRSSRLLRLDSSKGLNSQFPGAMPWSARRVLVLSVVCVHSLAASMAAGILQSLWGIGRVLELRKLGDIGEMSQMYAGRAKLQMSQIASGGPSLFLGVIKLSGARGSLALPPAFGSPSHSAGTQPCHTLPSPPAPPPPRPQSFSRPPSSERKRSAR